MHRPVAYRLGLPADSRVHPVFHVSLLCRCLAPPTAATSQDIPPIGNDGSLLLHPKAILETRWMKRGSHFVEELLIKWKSLPASDASWELASTFHDHIIQLVIEDNAGSSGGGNDTSSSRPTILYCDE
ncbi:unnamed protein product [Linum trigynum]|uniref:Chromo domain-containing protein n=1 Tax=Linum trigynum TaxID=586398 RepID=A0AAV2DYP0_9ROSI